MMGMPGSFGGRKRPRKKGERSATGKDRGNDGWSSSDIGDANQHPACLAKIDDVEEPVQESAEHGQRRDDNIKRACQRINDPLWQALDRGEIDALCEGRLCDEEEESERGNIQVRYMFHGVDPSNRATMSMIRAAWFWVSR